MVPPNPEALSRRISEIDLTARGPKDTLPEYGPRYSPAVLLKLRSANHDGSVETPDFKLDGVMTPPSISHPAVPPTTPTHHMTPTQHMSESDAEREDEGLALLEEEKKKKKKKKKKSSGAGKSKKAITGFEGLLQHCPALGKILNVSQSSLPILPLLQTSTRKSVISMTSKSATSKAVFQLISRPDLALSMSKSSLSINPTCLTLQTYSNMHSALQTPTQS